MNKQQVLAQLDADSKAIVNRPHHTNIATLRAMVEKEHYQEIYDEYILVDPDDGPLPIISPFVYDFIIQQTQYKKRTISLHLVNIGDTKFTHNKDVFVDPKATKEDLDKQLQAGVDEAVREFLSMFIQVQVTDPSVKPEKVVPEEADDDEEEEQEAEKVDEGKPTPPKRQRVAFPPPNMRPRG